MTIIYAKFPDGTYSAHGHVGEYDSEEALINDLAEYYHQRGEEVEFREDDLGDEVHDMKNDATQAAVCPLCGATYQGHPAISRTDNQTRICPDCGTRQAMAAMGADLDEQERIVEVIHKYTADN